MRRRRATVQWRHLVNWREARLVVANGPNILQMLLVDKFSAVQLATSLLEVVREWSPVYRRNETFMSVSKVT